MRKTRARKIVREWAQQLRPLRWTVDNQLCYGDSEVARAIRVLGADAAWEVCSAA